MKEMSEIKKVLVVGMARSGVAAAKMLGEKGVHVRLNDRKSREELEKALAPLKDMETMEYRLGEDPVGLIEGMDLVVISPGVPVDSPVVVAAKEKGVELIGELELAYRYSKGRLAAITGTNGKTTTSALTGEIFKNAGKRCQVVGNIGLPYSSISLDTREEDVTVCEVSSFQLETVDAFHPDLSAFLNVAEDHLDRHKTMENYIALKSRIFENQRENDVVVLNYDDPALRAIADQPKCRVVWFSRTQVPPVGAWVKDGMIVYGEGESFRPVCPAAEIYIPGPHNLENALAATALAMEGGVPAPVIRHTLRTFKGVEHRLEHVRNLDGVNYINDSKGTNVDSTLKAIESMTAPTVMLLGGSDKKVDMLPLARALVGTNVDSTLKAIESMTAPTVMLLGGSDKKVDMLPLARALVGSNVHHVVLMGVTADQIGRALDEVGYKNVHRAGMDFDKAINMARELAVPGGNVVLSPACASFDMFKDYEHRGREFKRIVNALEEKGV